MNTVYVRRLGMADYSACYRLQKEFTIGRHPARVDELWYLQHHPVYTLGLAGKHEHILNPGRVPVEQTDRGGQVTYHGPGQLVVYPLIDLKRRGISIRHYVFLLEQAVVDMLDTLGIVAERRAQAPGVYVGQKKIAALGIRVRSGCCYHGLSLNVDMDLKPFQGINPCGYPELEITQLSDLGVLMDVEEAGLKLVPFIVRHLGFEYYQLCEDPTDMPVTEDRHEVA